jgi:hypothetical protein
MKDIFLLVSSLHQVVQCSAVQQLQKTFKLKMEVKLLLSQACLQLE